MFGSWCGALLFAALDDADPIFPTTNQSTAPHKTGMTAEKLVMAPVNAVPEVLKLFLFQCPPKRIKRSASKRRAFPSLKIRCK